MTMSSFVHDFLPTFAVAAGLLAVIWLACAVITTAGIYLGGFVFLGARAMVRMCIRPIPAPVDFRIRTARHRRRRRRHRQVGQPASCPPMARAASTQRHPAEGHRTRRVMRLSHHNDPVVPRAAHPAVAAQRLARIGSPS